MRPGEGVGDTSTRQSFLLSVSAGLGKGEVDTQLCLERVSGNLPKNSPLGLWFPFQHGGQFAKFPCRIVKYGLSQNKYHQNDFLESICLHR